tara:strand:+ start:8 stop:367 length:360 start_codon:yes stop_codon:yes gene_type:complete
MANTKDTDGKTVYGSKKEFRRKQFKKKPRPEDLKKTLKQKQFDTYKSALDTKFDKGQRIQKTYEGASPTIKEDLKKRFKEGLMEEIGASSKRDAYKTFAKGGKVKLALRGGGRAYGKNS